MSRTVFYSKADVFQTLMSQLERDLAHTSMAKMIRDAAKEQGNDSLVREIDQEMPDIEMQQKSVKAALDDIRQLHNEYRALAAKGLLEA